MEHITVGNKEYPVTFTLNVMESIQDKYGSFDKWLEKVSIDEPRVSDITWLFQEFINEGIDIENEDRDVKMPKQTHLQVGRIITKLGMAKAIQLIWKLMEDSAPENEEDPNLMANQ